MELNMGTVYLPFQLASRHQDPVQIEITPECICAILMSKVIHEHACLASPDELCVISWNQAEILLQAYIILIVLLPIQVFGQ
jgi:hypothetical protein